jgi:hypothetical protein
MTDTEIVITFQSERELWYVQRGSATAMVSAEDMVHEYYRWRYRGAPGVWKEHAREFCRKRLEVRGRADGHRSDLKGRPERNEPRRASR